MSAAALLAEAVDSETAGAPAAAALLFQASVNADPAVAPAWLGLIRCLIATDRLPQAAACLEHWIATQPDASQAQATGHCLLAVAQPDAALGHLDAALALDPLSALCLRLRAAHAAAAGDLDTAQLAAETAVLVAPDDAEAQILLALIQADRVTAGARDLDAGEVVRTLTGLADRHPDHAGLHYRLEEWLLAAGAADAALARSQRFTALATHTLHHDPIALEWHLVEQGDYPAALALWCSGQVPSGPRRTFRFDAGHQYSIGHLTGSRETARAARRAIPALTGRAATPLAMLLLVKDEAALVRDHIAHHLGQGVERVLVTDNGSTDGTRDILADLQRTWPVDVIDEPAGGWQQDLWTSRMAWIAAERYQADWLFSADADEQWCADRPLPAAIAEAAAPYGPECSMLLARQWLMVPDAAASGRGFATTRAITSPLGTTRWVGRADQAAWWHVQLPKALVRGAVVEAIWPGNHYAVTWEPQWGVAPAITVRHHHLGDFAWFQAKVRRVAATMAANPRWGRHAGVYQRLAQLDQAGRLEAEWRRGVWPNPSIAPLVSEVPPPPPARPLPSGRGESLNTLAHRLTSAVPRFDLTVGRPG
ncbi:MAG: glycosyltransferase family 2 protein [Alphaproteobacteria bacterium]|nr:glycosyltransferase family 2 protein [Alphaproteobacteria bacterium]